MANAAGVMMVLDGHGQEPMAEILSEFIAQLPHEWTAAERERWLQAMTGLIDWFVVITPLQAGEGNGHGPSIVQPEKPTTGLVKPTNVSVVG